MTEVLEEPLLAVEDIAGGGSVNEVSKFEIWASSLPWISVEEAGVGGRPGRGMVIYETGI